MRDAITQAIAHEVWDYDPETGVFTWKERARHWFKDDGRWRYWNRRHAGKPAFETVSSSGYRVCSFKIEGKRMQLYAHRVAWLYVHGVWPVEIDHGNRGRADNRIANLSDGTHADNTRNHPISVRNKTGVTGLSKEHNKWVSLIGSEQNRERKSFHCFGRAFIHRKNAERERGYHPNHGKTNVVQALS